MTNVLTESTHENKHYRQFWEKNKTSEKLQGLNK